MIGAAVHIGPRGAGCDLRARRRAASGDGLPVPFDTGDNVGVANPGGGVRYATIGAGDRTIAVRTGVGTGEIQSTAALDGDWGARSSPTTGPRAVSPATGARWR